MTETKPARGALATALLAALALIAFAANSILCRAALGRVAIDATNFTLIRLASGAAMLLGIRAFTARTPRPRDRVQPLALFGYAAAFSFAYISLSAGTGALILFGSVQATIIVGALRSGERFTAGELVGLLVALGGLVFLVMPGLAAPSLHGSILMTIAGFAWGVYTLRGRGSSDPLGDTTRNFVFSVPPAAFIGLIAIHLCHVTPRGVILAVASGAITSALGYVIWFAALRGMSAIQAAMVQLAVPVIAATGGVVVLAEKVTARLEIAAVLVLGGIALAISVRLGRSARR